ncbi:nicotinate-nucleotide adenylyltransferase [Candidatus Pandoraea novymonadis]|uniref:Probable nicotinate-nucleotide adenylyltransferase n=1 Tax=Candidatus Pandoraea novymonadis TaxID=1808959 RepID=A0ABX5FD00_9BURK|nr:nicotinate-nucleotide adenylyltransferase [Candidatus Pandoraea novymonadis]PSB91668.1 putative nicotinate-nucleotide adenylyltransferase [Candidatus Pandoraea novymonadis]
MMRSSATNSRLRIAVLGGTFDPPHKGHLALGTLFARKLVLDELILMPVGKQPQKTHSTPAPLRLAMVRLAGNDLAKAMHHKGLLTKLTISTLEIDQTGPNYMVNTLRELRKKYGTEASLSLLVGSDQLIRLSTWYAWRELFQLSHICAATRPGFNYHNAPPEVLDQISQRKSNTDKIKSHSNGNILIDTSISLNISATELRGTLASARHNLHPPQNLLASVWQYIQDHQLYCY